jgi:hypothetical protein
MGEKKTRVKNATVMQLLDRRKRFILILLGIFWIKRKGML